MARYRIIIEGEVGEEPPGYALKLREVVEREVGFMLGKAWSVASVEQLPDDAGRGGSAGVKWINARIALSEVLRRPQLQVEDLMKEWRREEIEECGCEGDGS